eukprot:4523035-Pleurochrysis_carterae.AAC.1
MQTMPDSWPLAHSNRPRSLRQLACAGSRQHCSRGPAPRVGSPCFATFSLQGDRMDNLGQPVDESVSRMLHASHMRTRHHACAAVRMLAHAHATNKMQLMKLSTHRSPVHSAHHCSQAR